MDRNEFAEIISAKANASDLQTLLISILKSRDFDHLCKNDMLIALLQESAARNETPSSHISHNS